MNLKLIIALVNERHTDKVLRAAKEAGARGSTLINNARGSGQRPKKTFLGLTLVEQCDVLLFVVDGTIAKQILATINEAGHFDTESGTGMAFQVDVEDAVGLRSQLEEELADGRLDR